MKNFGLKPVYWIYTFVCLFNFLGKLNWVFLKRVPAITYQFLVKPKTGEKKEWLDKTEWRRTRQFN